MPDGARRRYVWAPYVASLAVSEKERGRGVGSLLMREAESVARRWGYKQLMLEVAQQNVDAIYFYQGRKFSVIAEDQVGKGALKVFRYPFWWEIRQVPKYLMRKSLRLIG